MQKTPFRSKIDVFLLLAYFSSAAGALFLNGSPQTFSLSLLLFFLASGCGIIVRRSLSSGLALGSIYGALVISRQAEPSKFWLTCTGFAIAGFTALLFAVFGFLRFYSLTVGQP
jgi:hypothetical protein